jgi:hypothetical protein
MARTNFQYEKRQRELEKKRKAEDKAKRKAEAKNHRTSDGQGETDGHGAVTEAVSGGEEEHD